MSSERRVVISGGAGFVGSNLCERYLNEGWKVMSVDNSITGTNKNLASFRDDPNFEIVEADITEPTGIDGPVELVLHFASLASPVQYFNRQVETLRAGSLGTFNTLDLARAKGARYLLASSSEVYGDPQVYPQPETYWGNVNPIGPRSMYDESKRFAESVVMAYHRSYEMDTRIVRLFNSYGPRMKIDDGRVVAEFIRRALAGKPIQIFGDGSQTRSLCYVADTVEAIWRVSEGEGFGGEVVNIGNPDERTILELARLVVEYTGTGAAIEQLPPRQEDPQRRCPDITRLKEKTGWQPQISLREGVQKTIEHYRTDIAILGVD
jgi:nucleoside-diphosphate-sugar epimerase